MAKTDNLTDFLTDVADAIRAKKGTTALINPQNFSSEIASIETGGGGGGEVQPEGTHLVQFIDIDGEILKSEYVADGEAATPPSDPSREYCTFTGWLGDYSAITEDTEIFPAYESSDGKTRFKVNITAGQTFTFSILNNAGSNTTTIDYGDGTTATHTSTTVTNYYHTYESDYSGWITFDSTGKFNLSQLDNSGNHFITDVIVGNNNVNYSQMTRHLINVKSIVIPPNITTFSTYSFQDLLHLKALVINATAATIDLAGVGNMKELKYVYLSPTLTTLGRLFGQAKDLTKIKLNNSLKKVGDYLFYQCVRLSDVTLPDGVTSIGQYAFQSCYSLASINIPDGVTSIGQSAFQSCYSLASINIPDGVTSIGQSAFQSCYSLAIDGLPENITSIDTLAFAYTRLTGDINLPNVTGTLKDVFQGTKITSIYCNCTYADRSTGSGCFGNIDTLVRAELPSIIRVGDWCFQYDTALELVILGDACTSINYIAFKDCTALTRLVVKATTPPTLNSNALLNTYALASIYVPDDSVDTYKEATNWASKADLIKPLSEFVE